MVIDDSPGGGGMSALWRNASTKNSHGIYWTLLDHRTVENSAHVKRVPLLAGLFEIIVKRGIEY